MKTMIAREAGRQLGKLVEKVQRGATGDKLAKLERKEMESVLARVIEAPESE
jgi:hypothetical protein